MLQAEADQAKNLLKLAFSQRVTADETRGWREKIPALLRQLKPGFKLWSDFTSLKSMDQNCAPDIEFVMDLCNEAGVAKVVRVIPDPRQDIGLNIMSLFHYRRRVLIVTCQTVGEGLAALADSNDE
jgi:hypothetical protein